MTMSVTAGGGAMVPLTSLDQRERNSLSTLLPRRDGSPFPGGSGGGWSLEEAMVIKNNGYMNI